MLMNDTNNDIFQLFHSRVIFIFTFPFTFTFTIIFIIMLPNGRLKRIKNSSLSARCLVCLYGSFNRMIIA